MNIEAIQEALKRERFDGWLFFDHHRRDPLAYRILGIPDDVGATRRWYYYIPAHGEPRKLVHKIESTSLDSMPGEKSSYSSWIDQRSKLGALLAGGRRVAMQYSPNCAIPYVSLIDGGTLDLVRNAGVEVASSADLIQEFEAKWSNEQLAMHLEAGKLVDAVRRDAFDLIGNRVRTGELVTEYEVQQFVVNRFLQCGLINDHGPIVAVNANSSDPHYEPNRERTSVIKSGDLVLLDMWAKLVRPQAVYYDITWTGWCGDAIPTHVQHIFEVVRTARKNASDFVVEKTAKGEVFAGYEVDDVARGAIDAEGLGDHFFHRTGHNIGIEVHGTGANMDNLESHDERRVIPGTCFSIEPGVYLPEFGIRSEVNVYVGPNTAQVTGEQQEQLVRI